MTEQQQHAFETWFKSEANFMYGSMPSPEDLARKAWKASQASGQTATFQGRVAPWLLECFGLHATEDKEERNRRFLAEALELVQACGGTAAEAHFLVDYVFGREAGETPQEVGGVMTTLAALCLAQDVDMHACAETELARVWTKIDTIRAKQAAKPQFTAPSPVAAQGNPPIDVSDACIDRLILEIRQLGASRDKVREMLRALALEPAPAVHSTQPASTMVFGAETVLTLLDSRQWRLSRSGQVAGMTVKELHLDAWFVERLEAPFRDSDGMGIWFGPTPIDAFKNAHRMLGMSMPATAPAPISPDVARRIAELETYEPTLEDIEKFKLTLSRLGIGTPEGLEELGIKWHSYIRMLMRVVLHARPTSAAAPAGQHMVPDVFISHFCNALNNLGDLPINAEWAKAWVTEAEKLLDDVCPR